MVDADDVDQILRIEESQLSRDKEIERIIAGSEHDYFSLLTVNPIGLSTDEIIKKVKNVYRKKALLIHPDKTTNPLASTAFDRLKKAEQILSSTEDNDDKQNFNQKQRLMAIYDDVNGTSPPDSDWNSGTNIKIRKRVSDILLQEIKQDDIEKLYQKREEQLKKDEIKSELDKRITKRKLDAKWEDDRDQRVENWRKFTTKVEKKQDKNKKKKKKVLA